MVTGTTTEDAFRQRLRDAVGNRRIILAIILAGVFLSVLDVQIVAIALPTITRLLAAPIGQTQWIATSYVITVLATVLIFGTISGSFGNGRLFKAGILIFTLGSFACGIAGSLPELILFRVIQALGASMLMSICIAIILTVFPPEERGRAMGFYTAVIAFGMIIGPAAGGFIVDAIGWPFIFFVNVPIGLLLLAASARYLTFDPGRTRIRLRDPAGAFLLVLLMAALAFALNTLANPPVQLPALASWTAVFLAALVLFVARERSVPEPFIDPAALLERKFCLPAISLILYLTATFVLLTAQPFYFEGVMGLRPSHIGLLILITPVTMILCAPAFGWVYDRRRWRGYAFTGLLLMGVAYILCGDAFTGRDFLFIVAMFVLIGIARAVFQGPNSIEIMAALPPSLQGLGSSVIISLQYLGIMLGISLTTILLTARLAAAGYAGPVLGADPALLAGIFGTIMAAGGIICLAGAAFSFRRRG